jgi:hypothetical protein
MADGIQVLAKAADIQFTTTKAWWPGIDGAETPEMKIQFVGSPDSSLDEGTGKNNHSLRNSGAVNIDHRR